MADKITLILKDESNKYLTESIESLSVITDKDLLKERYIETAIQLIDEGYSLDDIMLVTEQNETLSTNLGDGTPGTFNIWNTIFGGGKSAIKEQILRFIFVDILGMSEGTGQGFAIFFKNVNPLNIIKLFRGKDHCIEVIPTISEALVEVVINQTQFGGESQQMTTLGGIGKVGIRNIVAEAIRNSDLGEKLGAKLCAYIWDGSAAEQTPAAEITQPTTQTK
jgi:hypothetical protein